MEQLISLKLSRFAASSTQSVSRPVTEAETANDNPPEANAESSDEAHQPEDEAIEPLNTPRVEETAETSQLSLF